MNIEKVLQEEGRDDVSMETADLGSVTGSDGDLFVTTNEIFENFPESLKDKTVVLDAIDAGYRLIDTAYSYDNEVQVGAAITNSGVAREDLFVTTKAYIQQMGYEKTLAAFYGSLSKLRLDYLDLYLVRMPWGDYYGSWRAMEHLYDEGLIRAIGVCNFDSTRLMDLCYNVVVKPQVNQIERHAHFQRNDELSIMRELGVTPEAWAPFAEGLRGMFDEPTFASIAEAHGKTVAQVILRWEVQSGLCVISKSVHRERMEENLAIWDFELDDMEMAAIAALDMGKPSMLDVHKPGELKRCYDYLRNPVLTSL